MSAARQATADIAVLILAKALRAPLWLLISVVLARVLEPSGLGTWSMILAAASVLNQLLLHWTQSVTQRFGRSEWLSQGRLDATWATRWPSLAAGFGIVLFLVFAQPFGWPSRFYGLGGAEVWYMLAALLTLWLMAECQGLQQVRERFGRLAWSPIVVDLGFLAVLFLLLIAKDRRGVLDLGVAMACLFGMGLLSWILWLGSELRQVRPAWSFPSRSSWRRSLVFAAPLIPGFLVGYLAEWCDYFLIRHFYTEHEVGLFHPAYQYMLILVGLPTAVASVLLPKLSAVGDSDDGAGMRQLIERRAPQFTAMWILLSLAIVAVLPALLAWFLGPLYGASAELLRILLVAVPGAIVAHVYGVAYFMQGRLGIATVVLFGIKCAVNLTISFVLLPRLGVVGSAMGSAVSYLVLQWLFLIDQHRYVGIRLGSGAIALLLAHLSGIALCWIGPTELRLLVFAGVSLVVLQWARHAALFSREEVSDMLPRRSAWAETFLHRVLCRPV